MASPLVVALASTERSISTCACRMRGSPAANTIGVRSSSSAGAPPLCAETPSGVTRPPPTQSGHSVNGLAWSTCLDYFDEPFIRYRVSFEAGTRDFDPGALSNLAEHQIYGAVHTKDIQSPVRSYFEAAWWYYGLIPAISAILLAAALVVDRRLSTLTLAVFALASAASHVAFSTEPVPRYLIVAAWVNVVVAGRIASVLATRLSPSRCEPALLDEAGPGFKRLSSVFSENG